MCKSTFCNDPAVSAQLKPLKRTPRGGLHAECLVRSAVVVGLDPVADDTHREALDLEAVPVHTLLPQGSNQALEHAVLLRAVRGDEFLLQAVDATGEDQAVV